MREISQDPDVWPLDIDNENNRRESHAVYLFAPHQYWRMAAQNPGELARIAQGCGPHGFLDRIVPDKLAGLSIKAACRIHDFMYFMGDCEADREQADRVFLNNMIRLVSIHTKRRWLRWWRLRLAVKYYQAVKHLGAVFFWDGKNEPENLIPEWEVIA